MSDFPPHLRSPLSRLAASCAEPFYAATMGLRNRAFDRGLRRIHRAHVPVISVGNITTGGTGKTPMVIALVRMLTHMGHAPAVLLRGYHRDAQGRSDEQDLLTHALPQTPIVANPDRVAGAAHIARHFPQATVILLDDGFQHRRLHRDLDIVLVDATNPFGHGRVLPRGLLRESVTGLRRAHAVIVTRADRIATPDLHALDRQITHWHGKPPAAHTAFQWSHILNQADQTHTTSHHDRVWLVAGIGNPDALLHQAAERFTLAGSTILPDHAAYDTGLLNRVLRDAASHGAAALLTTEKDWVKLRPLLQSAAAPMEAWRPRQTLHWLDGEGEIRRLVSSKASIDATPH